MTITIPLWLFGLGCSLVGAGLVFSVVSFFVTWGHRAYEDNSVADVISIVIGMLILGAILYGVWWGFYDASVARPIVYVYSALCAVMAAQSLTGCARDRLQGRRLSVRIGPDTVEVHKRRASGGWLVSGTVRGTLVERREKHEYFAVQHWMREAERALPTADLNLSRNTQEGITK